MSTIWTDIQKWLANPLLLKEIKVEEFQTLCHKFQACELIHWLYLKRLVLTNDVRLKQEIKTQSIFISNRKLLFKFLFESEDKESQNSTLTTQLLGGISGDYFSLMENQNQQQSLKNIAAQLKAERLKRNAEKKSKEKIQKTTNNALEIQKLELQIKNQIKNKEYHDALAILKQLNLKNPKKSAYFADQIKYIETIIRNNK